MLSGSLRALGGDNYEGGQLDNRSSWFLFPIIEIYLFDSIFTLFVENMKMKYV